MAGQPMSPKPVTILRSNMALKHSNYSLSLCAVASSFLLADIDVVSIHS